MQAESVEFIGVYLHQIIEVAVRATLAVNTTPDATLSTVQTTKELSAALLEMLEGKVGSALFIGAFSEVQRRVQSSKAEKKRQLAAEAITDPQHYAARKVSCAMQENKVIFTHENNANLNVSLNSFVFTCSFFS